ncbi:MAG: hypothetical protein LQ343_005108 [Gyalolechia ehrenbergii]|nr:MAG: hypothetical protein LQ343_005108 [Gyalolechia ehrenbergii]
MPMRYGSPAAHDKEFALGNGGTIPQLPTNTTLALQTLECGHPGQNFPLMKLPPELRRMVYLEILRPSNRDRTFDAENSDKFIVHRIRAEELQLGIQDSKHRANFLVTNKQINAEGSEVWYATHYFKATIHLWLTFEGGSQGVGSIRPTPMYIEKLRTLEIHITVGKFSKCNPDPTIRCSTMFHSLELLCRELISNCHELRSVIFVVACTCHKSENEDGTLERWLGSILTQRDQSCLISEEFEQLTKPLRRLRVSRTIQLRSICKTRAQNHQPIFDQLASVVKSTDPV